MSVKLMDIVYGAHFYDARFVHQGKKKNGEPYQKVVTVSASKQKAVCLAMADHANDEGEGSYPAIDTLMDKTELSRPTVVYCMEALILQGAVSYVGRSKWNTKNYTIHKKVLEEWEKRPKQSRKKGGESKASLLLESKTSLLSTVKPVYFPGKASLLKPSLNHPETVAGETPAQTPAWLGFEQMKALKGNGADLTDRINQYPEDCRQTLGWFAELWKWPVGSIPEKPKRGAGGAYAQWINEIRGINRVIGKHGRRALQACVKPCEELSVSHPAAINWCLPGEVGKLEKSSSSGKVPASAPVTAFSLVMNQRTPMKRPAS